jgi:hypothetical protein
MIAKLRWTANTLRARNTNQQATRDAPAAIFGPTVPACG